MKKLIFKITEKEAFMITVAYATTFISDSRFPVMMYGEFWAINLVFMLSIFFGTLFIMYYFDKYRWVNL